MVEVSYRAPETEAGLALKQLAAERLAAHRSKRAAVQAQEAELQARVEMRRDGVRKEMRSGASRVREAVAARYEQSVSYREFLAAESKRALEQAEAEAEVAARNARAIAEAQKELIAELAQWSRPAELAPRLETKTQAAKVAEVRGAAQEPAPFLSEVPGLRVQMIEGLDVAPARIEMRREAVHTEEVDGELHELEQEIAFRLSPGFEDQTLEMQAIPGNIIEFPRPMVASRKARPRLAEGPLRAEAEPEPQLRIFEVEAEQISVEPEVAEPTAAPEWQNLMLDATTAPQPSVPLTAQAHYTTQPQAAALERRLMAAAVDGCVVGAAFVGFATVAVRVGHGLHGMALAKIGISAGVSLLVFSVMYAMLFFSLNEATPGMRYARIGLCTFGDENPSRKAMRMRVLTTLLAACPVGLGLLWACMDSDRLGWHDRISKMYQRAY